MTSRSAGSRHATSAERLALCGHLAHELFHLREVRLFLRVGEDASAELDHDPAEIFEQLPSHRASRQKGRAAQKEIVTVATGPIETVHRNDETNRCHFSS